MPAFAAHGGMPYWIDLRSSDPRKSRYFYSKLLGWEVTGEPEHLIARREGLPVAGILPNDGSAPDTWVTYFLADDIDQLARDVATAGGRVLVEPTDVPQGRMSIAADNAGGLFGLIEPVDEEAFIAAGEPGTVVWHDYSATSQFRAVIDFYHEVFGWDLQVLDDGAGTGFATALSDGAAFAGLRDAEKIFSADVPSFWQSFLGVADVDQACRVAADFGGEVIRAPFEAEFGRLAIIADSTGATVTLCEVDEPVIEEDLRESDDILNL
ncbi:glyoxalase [Corynebacterium yudongzhengii]|uniref:VOC family protein n=1 Tax=Corynebacterium yudongzhengii TaxID=2080740 RepID=A0A2U1T5H2_9CORY|nr:VOC family protein [Corynebacterium yudongzhengii]AWB81012.1 glyoxalase [Corynebacterium yudongzhengii]PWC01257.1 VOC family protein [Corynebacterium yudongzhengii]